MDTIAKVGNFVSPAIANPSDRVLIVGKEVFLPMYVLFAADLPRTTEVSNKLQVICDVNTYDLRGRSL